MQCDTNSNIEELVRGETKYDYGVGVSYAVGSGPS